MERWCLGGLAIDPESASKLPVFDRGSEYRRRQFHRLAINVELGEVLLPLV